MLTRNQLEELRQEAGKAGDEATVRDCTAALAGDERAAKVCYQIVVDACAMDDELGDDNVA